MSEETIINITEGYTETINRNKTISAYGTITSTHSGAGFASLVTIEALSVDIDFAVVGVARGRGVDALAALKDETICTAEARCISDIAAGQTTFITRKTNSIDHDETLASGAVNGWINAGTSLEDFGVEARGTIKVGDVFAGFASIRAGQTFFVNEDITVVSVTRRQTLTIVQD